MKAIIVATLVATACLTAHAEGAQDVTNATSQASGSARLTASHFRVAGTAVTLFRIERPGSICQEYIHEANELWTAEGSKATIIKGLHCVPDARHMDGNASLPAEG